MYVCMYVGLGDIIISQNDTIRYDTILFRQYDNDKIILWIQADE